MVAWAVISVLVLAGFLLSAAFDTTVPHGFGNTGKEPAEIPSIFGRPGERR